MDTDGTAHLVTVPTTGDAPPEEAVLLGEADGVAYWAVRDPAELVPGEDPVDRADLRTAGAALDALGAGLLTIRRRRPELARHRSVLRPRRLARRTRAPRAGTGCARQTATRTTRARIPR